jgi:hypothetical protein
MKRISKRIHFCWDNQNCKENRGDQRHAGRLGNRRLRFMRRTVFGLCRWSRMFSRSGKSKRDPNTASGCQENWGTLSSWDSMRGSENGHSVSQFSRQPLIAINPRFVFPDRFSMHKRIQGTKVFRGTNLRRRFSAWVASPRRARDHSVSQISRQPQTLFRALFRVSGPIQHELKHGRAENIPPRESHFAFSSGSLLSCTVHEHSKSQFSRQPQTLFVPHFVFPDRFSVHKHCGRPKEFRGTN